MLEKIDIHLTDHCNLNCKGCTHFSPLSEEFYLDYETFKKDIDRMAQLSNGRIKFIFLLGGEPLLHPNITQFFPHTRFLFPKTRIVVITNGILLNNQDENFYQSCKDNKIELWVSDYALQVDYKKFEAKAKEYGVFLGYTSTAKSADNKKLWTKYKLDIKGEQYYANSFKNCTVKNCVTLKKGKLYTCPTIAHIEHFNKFFNQNLEVSEFDYIDIYKIQDYDALCAAMVKPVPFCRYCKPLEFEQCYWEPSKKDINEWI